MSPQSTTTGSHVKVTQVRSGIGTKPKHRATLRALGLRGIGRSRVLPASPSVRGMISKVLHLVEVSEVHPEERAPEPVKATSKSVTAEKAASTKAASTKAASPTKAVSPTKAAQATEAATATKAPHDTKPAATTGDEREETADEHEEEA